MPLLYTEESNETRSNQGQGVDFYSKLTILIDLFLFTKCWNVGTLVSICFIGSRLL